MKKLFVLSVLCLSLTTALMSRHDDEVKRVYRPSYPTVRAAAFAGIVAAVLVKPGAVKEAYRDLFNSVTSKNLFGKAHNRVVTMLSEQKFNKTSPVSLDNVIRIAIGFGAYEVTQKVIQEIFG